MPLVHVVGVTSRNTTFDIAYCFVPNELTETYMKVVQFLHELFEWLEIIIKCFITDHDKALKLALTAIFPGIPQRRCIWHINQNVQVKAVKVFDLTKRGMTGAEKEQVDTDRLESVNRWYALVAVKTEEGFWDLWEEIENDYEQFPDLLKYLEEH
jgi:hypothetical protein